MRIASIDIGTNTVLLLIADVAGSDLTVLTDDHAIARLGEGVDATGLISEQAYQRLRATLMEHLISIEHYQPLRISAVATSAMRDAKNSDDIIRRVKQDTGIAIEIISGEDEARWTFLGSVEGLDLPNGQSVTVVDIGGGSTELACGTEKIFHYGTSSRIGAVRLTERINDANLSLEEARAMVRASLGLIAVEPSSTLVAVAGTPTSLAAMEQQLDRFNASRVHGYRLSLAAIDDLLRDIWDMPAEEIVARYPSVNPARADILAAGSVILREALTLCGADACTVSVRGLRYGIALRAAGLSGESPSTQR
jgi:exopolyphosphatase/guanosine-5'-triphosphate,3'-diphosphate pyrophosphatase